MESDMADIRGGIYIHLPRSRTRQKISANNKWPNKPKQRAMMRGKWGIPILLQGATNHHLTMRHVNNERSWKIVKIELQLQNAESWKSKHCHAPPGRHTALLPTHTHSGKVNAYEKRQEAGKRLLFFLGAGESNLHILQQIDNKLQCDIQLSWWPRCPWLPAAVGQRWKLIKWYWWIAHGNETWLEGSEAGENCISFSTRISLQRPQRPMMMKN